MRTEAAERLAVNALNTDSNFNTSSGGGHEGVAAAGKQRYADAAVAAAVASRRLINKLKTRVTDDANDHAGDKCIVLYSNVSGSNDDDELANDDRVTCEWTDLGVLLRGPTHSWR